MIKFHRSFAYFLNKENDIDYMIMMDPVVREKSLSARLKSFMEKYNCTIVGNDSHIYHCSEEDFVMIMLTCPEVVKEVL